jgi:hypothetical protein
VSILLQQPSQKGSRPFRTCLTFNSEQVQTTWHNTVTIQYLILCHVQSMHCNECCWCQPKLAHPRHELDGMVIDNGASQTAQMLHSEPLQVALPCNNLYTRSRSSGITDLKLISEKTASPTIASAEVPGIPSDVRNCPHSITS